MSFSSDATCADVKNRVRLNENLTKPECSQATVWSTDARRPPSDHSSRSRGKLPRLWSHDGVVSRLRSW
ncbi:hypothetical protein DPMN_055674 [Dreissena polymorpha]|uniref:Uncharacterized protein n=1 Tax=Dreissena polymorpha TaxID=45954 RepID=A0A9D4CT39_DREPO|nr:hypothetical protein DPMN_055674 [Dreissena polymorpha]